MAQHDFVISNQGFPAFRSDLNDFLNAVRTTHSGTSTPSGASAGTIWLDTTSATTPTLKYYDGTDNISLATIDHVGNTVNWLDSTVSITGISTTATGTVLTLTDSASTSTVNLIIDNQKEIRFRETTANGTNYVALKAPASVSADLTFTLPATDGTANQVLTTSGAGVLSFTNPPTGFRNIVINGDMSIAQRSTSVASITTDGYYTCDRWNVGLGSFGTWTQSQSTDVPSGYGFAKSIKMDCTTAQASPASGSLIVLEQKFEGQNLQYLRFGTANAKQLTLSFWSKHTKTGTNIVELIDADNSDAVSGSYTQSVSNTWEFKTITFPAKTSGALDNDNASSLRLRFIMGAGTDYTSGTLATTWIDTIVNANRYVGQVNNADSTSNDFIITGVQLEAGTSATDFEFLPIDVNINRCLRYFERWQRSGGIGAQDDGIIIVGGSRTGSSSCQGQMSYYKKRAFPTISFSSNSHFQAQFPISPFTTPLTGAGLSGSAGLNFAYFNGSQGGALGSDCASWVYISDGDGKVSIDAEL